MKNLVSHILNFVIFSYMVSIREASASPCYGIAQQVCRNILRPFWVAIIERDNKNICVQLQPLYDCTMESKTSCNFQPEDEELFESDIIQVYTKPPYNCPLTRTKLVQKPGVSHTAGQTGQATPTAVLSPALALTISVLILLA